MFILADGMLSWIIIKKNCWGIKWFAAAVELLFNKWECIEWTCTTYTPLQYAWYVKKPWCHKYNIYFPLCCKFLKHFRYLLKMCDCLNSILLCGFNSLSSIYNMFPHVNYWSQHKLWAGSISTELLTFAWGLEKVSIKFCVLDSLSFHSKFLSSSKAAMSFSVQVILLNKYKSELKYSYESNFSYKKKKKK